MQTTKETIDWFPWEDGAVAISEAILYLEGLQEEGYVSLASRRETTCDWCSHFSELYRPETPEEEGARLAKEEEARERTRRTRERKAEKERKQYERLKAKYGGD